LYAERLSRLQSELRQHQIDCIAIIPGANMRYLTGLDFHLMERPTVAFFPQEAKPVFVLGSLEVPRIKRAIESGTLYEADVVSYTDTEGHDRAYEQAMMSLPEIQRYAVEYLSMRVLELKILQRHVPAAAMQDAGPVMDALRLRKGSEEIASMRRAIAVSEAALEDVLGQLKLGMTEREIANMLTVAQLEAGGGVVPFEPIVLIGPNAAQPHGTPGSRPLKKGEVLLIDFGTSTGGYISDITRTFFVGQPSEKHRAVYEAVLAANMAGRGASGPDVPCEDVDRASRAAIEQAGFGEYFIHRTGHGIGMEGHEGPYIREGNPLPLEPGMTYTVEPGIYIEGEIGVRIEDNLVVTETGAETLTTFPRDLRVLDL
jgi:Xaa-Pro aminopeptidase